MLLPWPCNPTNHVISQPIRVTCGIHIIIYGMSQACITLFNLEIFPNLICGSQIKLKNIYSLVIFMLTLWDGLILLKLFTWNNAHPSIIHSKNTINSNDFATNIIDNNAIIEKTIFTIFFLFIWASFIACITLKFFLFWSYSHEVKMVEAIECEI